MRNLVRLVSALLLVLLPVGLAATPAHADDDKTPSSWNVQDYTLTAKPDRDGNVRVTLDLAFDFANDSGHGPFIVLPERMRIADDPDHYRELPVKVERVSSSTGANTDLKTSRENNMLVLRVGRQGTKYTGVQRYRVDYTVRGLVSLNNPQSSLDEVNWNAVGPAWQVPIKKATVTVEGPAAMTKAACFTGSGFKQPCEAQVTGDRAVFSATNLRKEVGLQAVAGYPAGTFTPAAAAQLSKRSHPGNMFPVTPVSGGLAALVGAVGIGLVALRVRRSGRDEVYAGLTPGLAPVGDAEGQTVRASGRQNVAVQFTPPQGARPGEIGTLIDEKADSRDVTATIVDLAVRGHLRIEQLEGKDFVLHALRSHEQVAPFEQRVLANLFQGREAVSRDDLKDAEFAGVMTETKSSLYQRVTRELGWFSKNPQSVRSAAVVGGILTIMAGAGLAVALGVAAGLGLVGVGIMAAGLALLVMSGRMPSRTAKGSAVLAQARGFEKYLSTAEADQIRFEEGVDIFSRYLPYAIAFGVAERWTKVFQQLAASGRYQADPTWYYSPYGHGFFMGNAFASSFDGLTASMESAIQSSVQAASASSSSSSGFSGGGGFGGGGGGGW